ncbi:L,D-transpeptidase family protein [Aquimonas sp.]|jgi:murein L,D-transpeptidase YafK|uniref:L,D-transpeptidase family protein n=1 Tax=Aquimonas sp. TaxID=1872588 RepID=UPI0037C038B0
MHRYLTALCLMSVLLLMTALAIGFVQNPASASERAEAAATRVLPALTRDLDALDAGPGQPVFLRIFKRESELELWVQPRAQGELKLFRTYPICAWSGRLGPKTREGDRQAPEGIYSIRRGQLNPRSQFHLSFNLGYPNAYERAQGWTGSALMVHGACVSIGCYAMTDPAIEEIYTLVDAALRAGQSAVPVHALPFRMDHSSNNEDGGAHTELWTSLAEIDADFDQRRQMPRVAVSAAGYRLLD